MVEGANLINRFQQEIGSVGGGIWVKVDGAEEERNAVDADLRAAQHGAIRLGEGEVRKMAALQRGVRVVYDTGSRAMASTFT